MHVDEAIQAGAFRQLLEEGSFDYLTEDGHGRGLLYFAIPMSKAAGAASLRDAAARRPYA